MVENLCQRKNLVYLKNELKEHFPNFPDCFYFHYKNVYQRYTSTQGSGQVGVIS